MRVVIWSKSRWRWPSNLLGNVPSRRALAGGGSPRDPDQAVTLFRNERTGCQQCSFHGIAVTSCSTTWQRLWAVDGGAGASDSSIQHFRLQRIMHCCVCRTTFWWPERPHWPIAWGPRRETSDSPLSPFANCRARKTDQCGVWSETLTIFEKRNVDRQ